MLSLSDSEWIEDFLAERIRSPSFVYALRDDLGADVLDHPELIEGGGVEPSPGHDELQHEVLSTSVRAALGDRVRQAVCRVVIRGCNEAVNNGDVMAVAESLRSKIVELYEEHVVSNSKSGDVAQFILWTDAMETPISTAYRLIADLKPEHLLTAIAKAQNSGAAISFKDVLKLEFVHVKSDPGWGASPADDVNAGRGNALYLCLGQEMQKSSLKQIADVGDNACMAKCIMLGVVHTALLLTRKRLKAEGGTSDPSTVSQEKRLADEYKKMGRKRPTNTYLDEPVRQLYERSGVEKGRLCTLEDLKKFEAVVGICIKVVSLNKQLKIIYPGKPTGDAMIYLLYTEDPRTKVGHFGLITNVRGFFSKNFYCRHCDVPYNNIYDHRCPDVKNWCFSCYHRDCQQVPSFKESCRWCGVTFKSASCRSRHLYASCKTKWRCPRCRRKFKRKTTVDEVDPSRRRPRTNAEMEKSHDCTHFYCGECKAERPDDHKCFIAKKKLEPKLCKFIFFDLETDQSSGEHVVNYIHARYFVRDPEDEKREEKAKKAARKAAAAAEDGDVEDWDDSHLSDHKNWKGEWFDATFSGESSLTEFFRFLTTPKFKDYTAIAHNMSGFDGLFLLREVVTHGMMPEVIVKGQRILMMKIPSVNVRVIDSFNFIPMGLSKLPDAFGLDCGCKGYFPHFANTPENANYVGPLPEPRFYGADLMSVGERAKFDAWYTEQVATGAVFDFKTEMARYCKQDVEILTESCLAYRKLMCLETGCDPFAYLTCASVCNAVYNANHMPPQSIARVPPAGYKHSRYSEEACEWLEHKKWFCGVSDMRHAGNSTEGEKKATGPRQFSFDGFSESRNTVYEYYGCFWHGCRHCYSESSELRNPDTQKLLTVSYEETMKREAELRDMGYTVESVWACQWKKLKEENEKVREEVKLLGWVPPLNPRDAFFGGRTEAFKLSSTPGDVIGYEDVTSLYPYVNFWMQYPLGHPEIITHGFKPLSEYFGLVKCTVLPPRDLYIPVLPKHAGPTKKLIFPLCSTCADTFQTSLCTHSDEERALQGTWFTEEVKLAVEKGYRVLKIHSVWHFKEKTDLLFREYVKEFYLMKLLSSKLSLKNEEEVRQYMAEVYRREQILIKCMSDFKLNPGLRQLAKLMLNNLWGRYGMRENLSKSIFLSDVGPLVKLMTDPLVEVQGVRVITEDCVQVIYQSKCPGYLATPKSTNIFIAVATTAWARIKLYSEMDKLGERVMYCDTDSVIYKRSPNSAENLVTGNFLGDMTDELKPGDSIVSYVSGGPKNYGYRTAQGDVVVKIRGFTLNCVNAPAFVLDNVRRVILSGVVLPGEGLSEEEEDEVDARGLVRGGGGGACGGEEEGGVWRAPKRSTVERVPHQCPKRRKLMLEKERLALRSEHLELGTAQSALAKQNCISVYNATRIQRTAQWRVLQTAEQKLYSFCFDKRIILSNYDSLPYGYVGSLG